MGWLDRLENVDCIVGYIENGVGSGWAVAGSLFWYYRLKFRPNITLLS